MSVFRELPQLAKHVIIRILFINQPIARQLIDSWVRSEKRDSLEEAITAEFKIRFPRSENFQILKKWNFEVFVLVKIFNFDSNF